MSINCCGCSYCLHFQPHPYYCYILTDRRYNNNNVNKLNQTVIARIGLSRHPIHRLHCHNRRPGYKKGPSTKSTKEGAGYYQIEYVVGPFFNGNGIKFKEQWSKKRKLLPRLKEGLLLAKAYNYEISARDKDWLIDFYIKYCK